jgi:hypothetical protein
MFLVSEARFEKFAQDMAFSLHEIQSNVKVTSHNITPSVDCESSAESKYVLLMETLGLDRRMSLSEKVQVQLDNDACQFSPFEFKWNNQVESASYESVQLYLQTFVKCSHIIANGQNCPHGHFFTIDVFTLRRHTNVTSDILRETGAEPKLKFSVAGRSDIAVLSYNNSLLSRTECRYCVEIKRVIDMEGVAATNKALREGVLQLIGLNVQNHLTSPSVLVTNLNKKHFVLFISRECHEDDSSRLLFSLKIHSFSSFPQALFHANQYADRDCCTHLFGSPPTPVQSIYDESEDEDDVAECKVNVTPVHNDVDDA